MLVVYHLGVSYSISTVVRSQFRLYKFIQVSDCVHIKEIIDVNNIGLSQVSPCKLDYLRKSLVLVYI